MSESTGDKPFPIHKFLATTKFDAGLNLGALAADILNTPDLFATAKTDIGPNLGALAADILNTPDLFATAKTDIGPNLGALAADILNTPDLFATAKTDIGPNLGALAADILNTPDLFATAKTDIGPNLGALAADILNTPDLFATAKTDIGPNLGALAADILNTPDLFATAKTDIGPNLGALAADILNTPDLFATAKTDIGPNLGALAADILNTLDISRTMWALQDIGEIGFTKLVDSVRSELSGFDLVNIEERFEKVPDGEALLARSATQLNLTVPFTHDPAVRVALQMILTAIFTTLMMGLIVIAPTAVALVQTLVSPKTSVETWKAVGAAYDKLYDPKHYHPEKGKKQPPSGGPQSSHGNGVW